MADDTSVVNLLMDRVVDTIETVMIDSAPDPETTIGLARFGKLQDDPTVDLLNLLVNQGGDDWPDILIPPNYPYYAPQYEMPLGNFWLRRMYANYILFFNEADVTRDEARRKANVIFSRFKHMLYGISLVGMTDTFNETAFAVQLNRLEATEGGGPGTFIWRAKQYFEFITEQAV